MRDITEKQFAAICKKRGWIPGLGGYVHCNNFGVCRFNGGTTLRSQVAYLIRSFAALESRYKEPTHAE